MILDVAAGTYVGTTEIKSGTEESGHHGRSQRLAVGAHPHVHNLLHVQVGAEARDQMVPAFTTTASWALVPSFADVENADPTPATTW